MVALISPNVDSKKKKRIQMNFFLQNRSTLTDFEKLTVTKGDRWGLGRMDGGLGLAGAH